MTHCEKNTSASKRKENKTGSNMMKKIRFAFTAALWMMPQLASANITWPALVTETRINSVPIILISLLLEFLVIRKLFKIRSKKALWYTLCANLISGLMGWVLRPLSGLLWEFSFGLVLWLFSWGTYNPVTWLSVAVIGGAANAALELLTIKLIWKERFTKNRYLVLWLVNGITVGFAIIWIIFAPSSFMG